jgi:hypothetical protein
MLEFYRKVSSQILDDLSFFPAVGIIGPRQVGKTTLAKTLQEQIPRESIYLDLELDSDRIRLEDAESYLKLHEDKCVIIDEIQRMPELFALLRALIDRNRRPARFILLGSASPELIRGTSETLAGRIAYTEVSPLIFSEVADHEISLHEHWLKGGYPEVLKATLEKHRQRWMENYVKTYVFRDLRELGINVSANLLEKLLEMLTTVHGNILLMSELARSLGVSAPTIARYLDVLEGSFMIRRLQPYSVNISKRLVKSPKLYFCDSGIFHYLAKIQTSEVLFGHILVGASWEGYVVEQIITQLSSDWQFFFYRTHAGAECDLFGISPTGRRICVEIKRSNSPTVSKGFYESIKDLKADDSFVVVPSGETYVKNDGISVINLPDFLQKITTIS